MQSPTSSVPEYDDLVFDVPIFDSSDSEDERRIRANDLKTRADRTYEKEQEVMKNMETHTHQNRQLHTLEHVWRDGACDKNEIERVRYEDYVAVPSDKMEQQFSSNAATCQVGQFCTPLPAGALRFEKQFVHNGGKPCIITNLAKFEGWPALEKWKDVSSFCYHYGNIPVHITEMFDVTGLGKAYPIRIPTKMYCEYAQNNNVDFPFYPFERDFENDDRHLFLKDWSHPQLFNQDLYGISSRTRTLFPWTCHRFLLIGGKRTGANLHRDPKGSAAWNTLLSGRKRWIFFPPDIDPQLIGARHRGYNAESPVHWWLDHYPRLREQKDQGDTSLGMIECIQERDETIFIPPGWYHAILNLDDFTIAATSNILSIDMFQQQYQKYFATELPDLCDTLVQEVHTLVPEILEPEIDHMIKESSHIGTEDRGGFMYPRNGIFDGCGDINEETIPKLFNPTSFCNEDHTLRCPIRSNV